ncbi:50S ribosomal protein L31 [Mycoplasma wenyonii str. Massachusetts]|uniref:50S ribosomal protein L31 n=1 Tax=Mycoplasma wenyonii (strain Massachusetts) TaxID=1197325 RepID=I6Z747_MYCWM|nr:50S ribosomal protein L31 [Mycoplasma wenyonii]AFN65448.1 50S ribosomal protein L31 [Mycoplasma wenyonii str. Massachusetts]
MSAQKQDLSKKLVTYSCNSCGSTYKLLSGDLSQKTVPLDICAACHPFYQGKLASESTLGLAEKLKDKFTSGRKNIK